jgi:hypothetical protein
LIVSKQSVLGLEKSQQKYEAIEKEYSELKHFLRSIKTEIQKVESYRLTIQTQEKVIAKLQSIMESKIKSKFSFLKDVPTIMALPEPVLSSSLPLSSVASTASISNSEDFLHENAQLRDQIVELTAKVGDLIDIF